MIVALLVTKTLHPTGGAPALESRKYSEKSLESLTYGPLGLMFLFTLCLPQRTFAHCDGLDGPVVKALKKALESGDVSPVVIWVQKIDEKTGLKKGDIGNER